MKRLTFVAVITVLFTYGITNSLATDDILQFEWEQIYPDEALVFTWSPDSQFIAFIDTVTRQNLYILNVQTKKIDRKFPLPPQEKGIYGYEISWSPNGTYFAIVMNGQSYVMDSQNGEILLTYSGVPDAVTHKYGIRGVRWSQDSVYIAVLSAMGYIYIFDIKTGNTLQTIDFHEDNRISAYSAFDWSPDGSLFAVDRAREQISIWDKNGKPIIGQGKEDKAKGLLLECPGLDFYNWNDITSLNLSKGSRILAVGSTLGLWICGLDKDDMISFKDLDNDAHFSPVWSPDGHWLVSTVLTPVDDLSNKCELKVFDARQDYKVQIIKDKICSYSLAWSPNGQQLAVKNDGHLWVGTVVQS